MTKESILSLVRTILTALGAYLFGKTFLGNIVDETLWVGIVGIAITVASTLWSFLDKQTGVESLIALAKQVFTFVGGLLVVAGKLTSENFAIYFGILGILGSWILSNTIRKKNKELEEGKISVAQLKK